MAVVRKMKIIKKASGSFLLLQLDVGAHILCILCCGCTGLFFLTSMKTHSNNERLHLITTRPVYVAETEGSKSPWSVSLQVGKKNALNPNLCQTEHI